MIALLIIAATTQINLNAIKADSWTPGDTPFVHMTRDERAAYLLAEEPEPPRITYHAMKSAAEPEPLPEAWDWMLYQTPVRDQGPCGSCWAFSTMGAVEAAYRIALEDATVTIDLSEQFAVSCLPGGCSGGLIETVVGQLEKDGIPDEACFPYTGRDFAPCAARCDDWRARTFRIVDWAWVIPGDDDGRLMRQALQRGPVVTAMLVYEDMWAYTGGVYEHVYGTAEGFHAIELVGYNGDVWIAKNSWGTAWGESGYLRIREGQSGIASYGVQVYVKPEDVPDVKPGPVVGCGCNFVY